MTIHFLELSDIPASTLRETLDDAHRMKREKLSPRQALDVLSLLMMFDKKPTRTRLSFKIAMKQLGC